MARKVKYMEIYHRIKEQILAGEYRVGDRLPTEKEFAERYEVSVHTVRQAMGLFKTEGVIRKVAGSGTFVEAMPGAGSPVVAAKNIGIVVWQRSRHIFPRILPAIEETIFPHGYHNVVCNTGNDPQREREVIERLIEQGIRGFIISPISWSRECLQSYRYIQDRNIPLVMINRRARAIRATSVSVNNAEAGYMATRRLLEAGHRKIGHLTAATAIRSELTNGRIRGYRRALRDFDVPFDERLIVYDQAEEGRAPGFDGAMRLLARNPDVTGIFCVNDHHVPGLIQAAEKAGRRMPDDLSVVSFDQSMEIQNRLPFQLDTQKYPAVNVGICAARELLAQIENDDSMVKTIELDPIPVHGHSCLEISASQ